MFVVTSSGEGDHDSEEEGGEEGTQPPGFTAANWAETVQLPSQVQGSEAQTSKRNYDNINSFRVAGSGLFGQYKTALLLFKSFRLEIYIYFFLQGYLIYK